MDSRFTLFARRSLDPLNTIRVPNHGTKQGTGLYIIIIINWYRERVEIHAEFSVYVALLYHQVAEFFLRI